MRGAPGDSTTLAVFLFCPFWSCDAGRVRKRRRSADGNAAPTGGRKSLSALPWGKPPTCDAVASLELHLAMAGTALALLFLVCCLRPRLANTARPAWERLTSSCILIRLWCLLQS